jgi:hypothetical protein
MKTLVSKETLRRMSLWVCFLSALPIAQGAEPITINMTADHWQTKENAEFLQQCFYHGLMRVNSGDAVLKDVAFNDGTIEFDVNTIGWGAPGTAFRQQDEGNFELLYLRPDPACPTFRACIQYAPLESKDRLEVPLAEEMAFLEHYLAIQKIRFGHHLRIETQIAPEVKYASVPCLFVQPLVENAIRHGISRRASGGTVIVSAHQVGERLDIRVLDVGVGLPVGWTLENSGGVGLSVTRQRVAELYPDGETCFAVNRRTSGGTEVEISLPLRWTGKDAHATVRV